MADLNFTLADVTSLAQKLSTVQNLTGPEHDLLLAIFAAAAARAKVVDELNQRSTLPQAEVSSQEAPPPIADVTPEILKDQLLQAYIPGNYFRAVDPSQNSTRGDQTL